MTFSPANVEASYLPATWNFSGKPEELAQQLNTLYRRIAQSVGDREIARYDCVDQGAPIVPPGFERTSGQKWYGATNQDKRPGFRKVVLFPALAAGLNTQAHNLGSLTSYTFTRIDGYYSRQQRRNSFLCQMAA